MREFKGGAELRLTKEDLEQALEHVLNDRILGVCMRRHLVKSLTLHPTNKYVVRIEFEPQEKTT